MSGRAPIKTNIVPGVLQECMDMSRRYVFAAEVLKAHLGGDPSVATVFESHGTLYGVAASIAEGTFMPFIVEGRARCICPKECDTDHFAHAIRIASQWMDTETIGNALNAQSAIIIAGNTK